MTKPPETAAKEEPKKPSACPHCGVEMPKASETYLAWRHPEDTRCRNDDVWLSPDDLEAWNRRASPWRDISEAKQDATPRLLWHWGFPAYVGYYSLGLGWVSDGRRVYPTHWQPIEPPEVQS